jgi:UDP-N-acetylglucosamine 4,6-dehydratase
MNSDLEKTQFIEGSSFLVTGGTGSFGKTMVKKLLEKGASKVRVFSRDESKQFNLRSEFDSRNLEIIIGDIRDAESLPSVLKNIDYVFHAAALKHVPPSENNPLEYVRTNVLGSNNLLRALIDSKVKSAVFLSTDKAVYPINAMGMTKALMEKMVRSTSYTGATTNSITRYGNVIGSRGSVIPYFINQIKKNKDILITDWRMTRFMMSLDESVDLVLYAMLNANNGDLFVRKAPSANLKTILHSVENLLGIRSNKIIENGIRPGEKIHETLLNSEERTFAKETDEFFQVRSVAASLDTTIPKRIDVEFTSENAIQLEVGELTKILSINPELKSLL